MIVSNNNNIQIKIICFYFYSQLNGTRRHCDLKHHNEIPFDESDWWSLEKKSRTKRIKFYNRNFNFIKLLPHPWYVDCNHFDKEIHLKEALNDADLGFRPCINYHVLTNIYSPSSLFMKRPTTSYHRTAIKYPKVFFISL